MSPLKVFLPSSSSSLISPTFKIAATRVSQLSSSLPRNSLARPPVSRLSLFSRQFGSSAVFNMSDGQKKIAIIAGVGAGTGGEIAKRFAKEYPVYLLSRNPDNTRPLVEEITAAGGQAVGISADVTSGPSVAAAFAEIKKHAGAGDGTKAAAAVYNASGRPKRVPFLELSEEDFDAGYRGSGHGAFIFAQAALPLLLNAVEEKEVSPAATKYLPPTLIFTGATASVKGSALFASFSPGKWAVRALSQNLAREFGPKGVHVSHAVIDGVIDIPLTQAYQLPEGGKISPTAIADTYWHLHTQPRTTFTWEVDIRPFVEKW